MLCACAQSPWAPYKGHRGSIAGRPSSWRDSPGKTGQFPREDKGYDLWRPSLPSHSLVSGSRGIPSRCRSPFPSLHTLGLLPCPVRRPRGCPSLPCHGPPCQGLLWDRPPIRDSASLPVPATQSWTPERPGWRQGAPRGARPCCLL